MSSKVFLHEKIVGDDGSVTELKIWLVSKSLKYPDEIKYSLYHVKAGKVLVGYDNHHPKGHHRHYGERQEPYLFTSVETLLGDFDTDRKRVHHES